MYDFSISKRSQAATVKPRVCIEARQVTTADGGQAMRPQAWVEATPRPTSRPVSETQVWTDPQFWRNDPSDASYLPWTAEDRESWQEWQGSSWRDDATRTRQRPDRSDRGPYAKGKGKGKKGKKGKDDRGPAS